MSANIGNNNCIEVFTNTRDNNITDAVRDLEMNLTPIDNILEEIELQGIINIMNLEIIVVDKKGEEKRILIKTEYGTSIADIREEMLLRCPVAR